MHEVRPSLASLLLSSVALLPLPADAVMLGDPAGVTGQAASSNLLQQVFCGRIWSCETWTCGWYNVCCRDRVDGRGPRGEDVDWRWMRWNRP